MRKIEAKEYKFIGKNGSLGLRNDRIYIVVNKYFYHFDTILSRIIDGDKVIYCEYSSKNAFNNNWEEIK